MDTIELPDGYEGNFVECECEPIEKDGEIYKLRVKGSHLIRWCTRQQWENAMYEAYTEEAYRSLESEYARDCQRMEREEKYRAWLNDEAG
jgi:hypothetical protein